MSALGSLAANSSRSRGKAGHWLIALLSAATIGCVWFPDPVQAQTQPVDVGYAELAKKASEVIQAKAPQAANLKKKMDEQVAQNEQTKQSYDKTFEELRGYDGPLADYKRDLAAYDADLAAYEADNNSYKARLADYESRCTQPPDDASYNACLGEYGNLSAEQSGIAARFSDLNNRNSALNSRSAELNQKVAALTATLDNYAQLVKSVFADWEANKKAFDQLSAELQGLRTQMANFCGSVQQIQNTDDDALEALKHCASLGWDGTNRTLPTVAVWIDKSSGGWGGISITPN